MIPSFPKFKRFQIEDREAVETVTKRFPPYCEFSIVSLLTWYDIEISILNDNLILRLNSYFDDKTPGYSLLGTNSIDETIVEIVSKAKKAKHETELILVPEPVINAIKFPGNFVYEADRNNFDYIVSSEEMYKLAGGRNRTKRQLVTLFSKKYSGYICRVLNLKDEQTQKDIEKLYVAWRKHGNKPENFLDHEHQGLVDLYPHVDHADLISLGLYYNSTLIGYSIAGLVNKPYAIHYYMKSDYGYRGVNTVLNKFTAEYLFKKGYAYINLESDLGKPGLRHAKILLHPTQFLKKYFIRLHNE